MADNTDGIFGGYAPDPDPQYVVTPRKGLAGLGKVVGYAAGCKDSDTHCGDYDGMSIKMAAKDSQLVIVCLGTGEVTYLMLLWTLNLVCHILENNVGLVYENATHVF